MGFPHRLTLLRAMMQSANNRRASALSVKDLYPDNDKMEPMFMSDARDWDDIAQLFIQGNYNDVVDMYFSMDTEARDEIFNHINGDAEATWIKFAEGELFSLES